MTRTLRKMKHNQATQTGLEIKKNPQVAFWDQLEKYSHQMQIFSLQLV